MVAVQVAAAQANRGESVYLHCLAHAKDSEGKGDAPAPDLAVRMFDLPGMDRVTITRHPNRTALTRTLEPEYSCGVFFHLHGVWDPILYFAAKIARSNRIPYAITPHGMLDPWSLTQSKWKKRVALAIGYHRMLGRASFIQLLNDDERRLMAPLKVTSEKRIVPNGVHLPDMDVAESHQLLQAFSPQLQPQRFFLFLARLHYKKGIDILLDAYAQMTTKDGGVWPLVIAGPDEGMAEEISHRVASGRFPGEVITPGPVYGKTKSALLLSAGAVVLPSRQEGFSLTILESLAASCPAIISDQCHFDQVGTSGAGLVVPVDAVASAEAMTRIQDMPSDAYRTMRLTARSLVETNYTWDRVAKMLINLYKNQTDS
jgi:glycosyltransferase involved in cell wall biosynthesis